MIKQFEKNKYRFLGITILQYALVHIVTFSLLLRITQHMNGLYKLFVSKDEYDILDVMACCIL